MAALRIPAVTVSVSPTVTGAFVAETSPEQRFRRLDGERVLTTVSLPGPDGECQRPRPLLVERDSRSVTAQPVDPGCDCLRARHLARVLNLRGHRDLLAGRDRRDHLRHDNLKHSPAGSGRCAVMLSVRPS